MDNKIQLLLEAEKRGILPESKKPLLAEARKRGIVPQQSNESDINFGGIAKQAGEAALSTVGLPTTKANPLLNSAVQSPTARGLALDFAQGLTGGYAKPALMAAGAEVPETSIPSKLVGQTAGFIAGPGKFLSGGNLAMQALKGAASGVAFNPSETEISGLGDRMKNAGIGAAVPVAVGGVGKAISSVGQLITPVAKDALKRALKAPKNNPNWDRNLDVAIPEIEQTAKEKGVKIADLESFNDTVLETKKKLWNQYQGIVKQAGGNAAIDGNRVADAWIGSIDDYVKDFEPKVAKSLKSSADMFRKEIPLEKAESYLQRLNKEIASLYRASKFGQYVKGADDELMAKFAAAKALRQEIRSTIDNLTGTDVQPLKNKLGALMDIYDVGKGRVNVSERQMPISLQEAINYGSAIADLFTGNVAGMASGAARGAWSGISKKANDTNNLIKTAFETLGKQPVSQAPLKAGMGAVSVTSALEQKRNEYNNRR